MKLWNKYVLTLATLSPMWLFSGCVYRSVTIYDDCFDATLSFSLKKIEPIYGFDYDGTVENRYSRLEEPSGEYIVCFGMDCTDTSSSYEKGWHPKYMGGTNQRIRLTGRYAFAESSFLLSWFAEDGYFYQAKLNGNTIWISGYMIDPDDVLEEDRKKIEYFYSKSDMTDWGHVTSFECPNVDANKHWWSHRDALD